MQRGHRCPVKDSPQAARHEIRPLFQFHRLPTGTPHPERQDGASGECHLCDEHEMLPRQCGAHPPEIHGVSWTMFQAVPPSFPHADPTRQTVEKPPQSPEPVRVIPSRIPPDPPDRLPYLFGGTLENHPAAFEEKGASRPHRITGNGLSGALDSGPLSQTGSTISR